MKFADDFLVYAKEFTGCSDSFLTWSALYALSSVASDEHVFRTGSWDIRPSLWILLTATSSSYKSAGLKEARDLIYRVDPSILASQVYSTQSLLEDIAANEQRSFFYNEAETYFKLISQSWNEGMRSLMMDLFDRAPIQKNIKGKKGEQNIFTITHPYICWAAASTPAQIAQYFSGGTTDLLSGFFPRILLIPESGKNRSYALSPPKDLTKFVALAERLAELRATKSCEYSISGSARLLHENWYSRITKRQQEADPILSAFYLKMRDVYFLKIALLSAFERGSSMIDDRDLEFATPLLWDIENNWKGLVELFTEDEWGRKENRVADFIRKKQVVDRSDLINSIRGIRAQKLTAILAGLFQDRKIKTYDQETKGRPRAMIEWIDD